MMQKLNGSRFQIKKIQLFNLIILLMFSHGCTNSTNNKELTKEADSSLVRLMTLAPGHFHAALLQKSMYEGVDSTVHVFAPEGPEVKSYLALINDYNTRKENPTSWKEDVYTGPDYLEKMLTTKPGNVVVISGNNKMKTEYIKKCVDNDLNVLADKPMAINKAGFDTLKEAFADAKKKKVLLYDIMTSRYEITNILQKAFSQIPDIFGELQKGTLENPAMVSESVHYFFKEVSGVPLTRPAWYLDVAQEGEGIVDVTTHLVDLIQWECFPEAIFDYEKDIKMLAAKRWATVLSPAQFRQVTKTDAYPDFLNKDVKDSLLSVYANGEMNYTIKDLHARVSVVWKYEPPKGTSDTYYSILRGSKTNLVIRQGKEQQYQPVLYLEPADKSKMDDWQKDVEQGMGMIHTKYAGLTLKKSNEGWEVVIPDNMKVDPEKQFSLVVEKYLQYLHEGNMPEWEISAMLAKYYTTTQGLEKALGTTPIP
ncbi:MAG: putative oxidoreductase C-terminal domain-containing protein [Ginsengibacter sp.]